VCSDPTPNGGCVTTLTDITETRRAEGELRRAKMIAEEANRAKSRFLTTMSHELRTPLNAVIGFSDTLMRDFGETADGGRVVEYAGAINDAGRQLLTLINSILDVARIEAGRVDIAAEAIDLPRLLRNCVRTVDNAAQAAEITVAMRTPPDPPVLYGDERRLRQVFLQLLSNAIKFTEAGGSVKIAAEYRPDVLIVSIEDTGIGIDEANMPSVFQPFSQVDGSFSRRFQGSGLGLYVARALVRAHGGELHLRSVRGVGTTAEVHLPSSRLHPTHNGGN
jgi:signal transduction histidine kinase